MNATTEILDVWQSQASENVDSHAVLDAIDESVRDSTEAACRNSIALLDWGDYNQVAL